MISEKREGFLITTISCIIGVLLGALGIRLFYLASQGTTYGFTFFGLTLEGKVLAAVITWLGFIAVFYGIRKALKKTKA